MFFYLQRTLYQALKLSNSDGSSTNNEARISDASNNCEVAIAAASDPIDQIRDIEATLSVNESEAGTEKIFTVDSANETSSSGGTENDFEIVSNENSPIASPATIMDEYHETNGAINGNGHDNFSLGDEVEDTDKFTKTLNNPKGVSEMELREKRQRLRYEQNLQFLAEKKSHPISITICNLSGKNKLSVLHSNCH